MFSKIFNFLIFIAFYSTVFAQYKSLPVKEKLDELTTLQTPLHYICTLHPTTYKNGNDEDGNTFGDGMAFILEGMINMHKTTGDKAYLYKFILNSMCMMENRHDLNSAADNNQPRWANDPNMYQDGYIVAAFARFVDYVKRENPSLINEPIYPFDELNPANYAANTCNCNKFGINFTTMGQYADWLQDRCGETLWWFISNGYWDDNLGVKQLPVETYGAWINMQVGFARAMLFIGTVANEPSLSSKASKIASLYKSNVTIDDLCFPINYSGPVLYLSQAKNAYWWYHAGWRVGVENCAPLTNVQNYTEYVDLMEDISHGAVVTQIPLDWTTLYTTQIFTATDMVRFRNMFTKSIYNGNGGFYDDVQGTGYKTDVTNQSMRVLNYMRFADFDGADATATAPNVYDIVFDFYQNNVHNSTGIPLTYGGLDNKGQSEIVQMQWKRECPDLTLYNRKVVYNQDFFSKGCLTIAPQETTLPSYAEPVITANEFTVEPGVNVDMTAANTIHFKAGTRIKPGASLHAYINPTLCQGVNCRTGNPNSNPDNTTAQTEIESSLNTVNNIISVSSPSVSFNVFPNPNTGNFTIYLEEVNQAQTITILNMLGEQVSQLNTLEQKLEINLSSYHKGVYFVNVQSSKGASTKKVVVN